jgi:MinD superfamily P-loop ATPase
MEIAVISGKGGSGKSSISAAFISMLSNVVAIDCDVDASNLHLLFSPVWKNEYSFISGSYAVVDIDLCVKCGRCSQICSFHAIKTDNGFPIIDEISCDGCRLCVHECPASAIKMENNDKSHIYIGQFKYGSMISGRLAPGEENSGKMVNELRQLSRDLANGQQCDIIILDGPPGIGCSVISTITGVDKVVVVTEPSISGFSDLKRVVTLLHHYDAPVYVIINKCTLNHEMTDRIIHWCEDENLSVIATLPFSEEMVRSIVSGRTIFEYNPNSEISKKLKIALTQIIN